MAKTCANISAALRTDKRRRSREERTQKLCSASTHGGGGRVGVSACCIRYKESEPSEECLVTSSCSDAWREGNKSASHVQAGTMLRHQLACDMLCMQRCRGLWRNRPASGCICSSQHSADIIRVECVTV
jgi:hypothetical protein